jgi:hypothetical protein
MESAHFHAHFQKVAARAMWRPPVGVEMLLVRDRVIEEMRKRTRPICVSCLGDAVSTEFLAVFEASPDAACALVFDRRHGICPECRCQQQLLFQPVIMQ